MPAYYLLKWVSPASLRAGGFGNDQDTPLAMLEEGFGAVAAALVADVDLEVRRDFGSDRWLGSTVRVHG